MDHALSSVGEDHALISVGVQRGLVKREEGHDLISAGNQRGSYFDISWYPERVIL